MYIRIIIIINVIIITRIISTFISPHWACGFHCLIAPLSFVFRHIVLNSEIQVESVICF